MRPRGAKIGEMQQVIGVREKEDDWDGVIPASQSLFALHLRHLYLHSTRDLYLRFNCAMNGSVTAGACTVPAITTSRVATSGP